MMKHYLSVEGATVSGRLGYRFVGDDLGFVFNSFLAVKHFQNKVKDNVEYEEMAGYTTVSESDSETLRRRFMSSLRLGLEFGWAF